MALGFAKIKWVKDSDGQSYPAPLIRSSYKSRRETRKDPSNPAQEQYRLVYYLTCYIDCDQLTYNELRTFGDITKIVEPRVLVDSTDRVGGYPKMFGTWMVEEFTADADGNGHDKVTYTLSSATGWSTVA